MTYDHRNHRIPLLNDAKSSSQLNDPNLAAMGIAAAAAHQQQVLTNHWTRFWQNAQTNAAPDDVPGDLNEEALEEAIIAIEVVPHPIRNDVRDNRSLGPVLQRYIPGAFAAMIQEWDHLSAWEVPVWLPNSVRPHCVVMVLREDVENRGWMTAFEDELVRLMTCKNAHAGSYWCTKMAEPAGVHHMVTTLQENVNGLECEIRRQKRDYATVAEQREQWKSAYHNKAQQHAVLFDEVAQLQAELAAAKATNAQLDKALQEARKAAPSVPEPRGREHALSAALTATARTGTAYDDARPMKMGG
jgi:hypothetical protein